MPTSMVTGRMDDYKKERGAQVLAQAGLTASQATFLLPNAQATPPVERIQVAAQFVDSLSRKTSSRFDDMTKAEIRAERLASRGLM